MPTVRLRYGPHMKPLHTFTSHTAGKNATVAIYPDRIEWTQDGSKIARAAGAAMTAGLSLLGGKKSETQTILMSMVTNVSAKRDGLLNSLVGVTTAGGTVNFRVSHAEAERVRQVILGQLT